MNKKELARQALRYVFTAEGAEVRLRQLEIETSSLMSTSLSEGGVRGNAFKAMLVSWSLAILQQFTGINAIIFYSTQIFQSKTDDHDIYSGLVVRLLIHSKIGRSAGRRRQFRLHGRRAALRGKARPQDHASHRLCADVRVPALDWYF